MRYVDGHTARGGQANDPSFLPCQLAFTMAAPLSLAALDPKYSTWTPKVCRIIAFLWVLGHYSTYFWGFRYFRNEDLKPNP